MNRYGDTPLDTEGPYGEVHELAERHARYFRGVAEQAEIELTYNYGVDKYELGTAYGHIALGVPDVYGACEKIRAGGGNVTREPGPVKGGTTVIAFVTDPDGYKIELIQRAEQAGGQGLR